MKKSTLSRIFTAAIIAFCAMLCLTACGDDAQSQSENSADATDASTVLTTTVSDKSEDMTTTTAESKTTTTIAQTTTVTEATTTTAETTTTAVNIPQISKNTENVMIMLQSIGITEDAETVEQYVAGAKTLDEMHNALSNYSNDTGKFSIDYYEQGLWDIQGCASMGIMYLIEMDGEICLIESADLVANTITIDGVCLTYDQALSKLGESENTLSIY